MAVNFANLIGWRGVGALGAGICCGVAEFLWRTTAQKVAMVATGLEMTPSLDPDDGPPTLSFEMLDKEFLLAVIKAPIIEEIACRGLFQPAITYGITLCLPHLAAPALLGISAASLISTGVVGLGFGALHYPNYEKGAAFGATLGVIAGVVFGVVREKFGLVAAMGAHMAANLSTGLLDKYWPALLEFKWERELRLLPPRERELRLLQEAVGRADRALAQSPSSEERSKLERFRSEWRARISWLQSLSFENMP